MKLILNIEHLDSWLAHLHKDMLCNNKRGHFIFPIIMRNFYLYETYSTAKVYEVNYGHHTSALYLQYWSG